MSSWWLGVQVVGIPLVKTGHFDKNETAHAVSVSGDSIASDMSIEWLRSRPSPLDRLLEEESPLDRLDRGESR